MKKVVYTYDFVFVMIRRPPRSTRTDTLFPYTTLCRSVKVTGSCQVLVLLGAVAGLLNRLSAIVMPIREHPVTGTILTCDFNVGFTQPEMIKRRPVVVISPKIANRRSEERRVGKECVSTCRSRCSPSH